MNKKQIIEEIERLQQENEKEYYLTGFYKTTINDKIKELNKELEE